MEFFFQTKPQERHFTSAGSGSLRLALRSSWREVGRGAEESREGAGKTAEDAGEESREGALGIRILKLVQTGRSSKVTGPFGSPFGFKGRLELTYR